MKNPKNLNPLPRWRMYGLLGMLALISNSDVLAINEGELDTANQFPNVGAVVALKIPNSFQGLGLTPPKSFSTCTLIHPRVALTAAHTVGFIYFLTTFDGLETSDLAVSFSPNGHDGTMAIPIKAAIPFGLTVPPINIARPDHFVDVGVIIFEEPVEGIDPVRLPNAGLLGGPAAEIALREASGSGSLLAVGYGAIDVIRPTAGSPVLPSGLRSFAGVQFLAQRSNYLLILQNFAQGLSGSAPGDSGGPLFWQTGNERVQIGIVSGGDPNNVSLGISQRTDTPEVVEFINTIVTLVEQGQL